MHSKFNFQLHGKVYCILLFDDYNMSQFKSQFIGVDVHAL